MPLYALCGNVRVSGEARLTRALAQKPCHDFRHHNQPAARRIRLYPLEPQVGLISVLLREFRTVLLLSPLYFVVFVAYAAVKALLIFGTRTPEEQFWADSGFAAASTATRLREMTSTERAPCDSATTIGEGPISTLRFKLRCTPHCSPSTPA